LIIIALTLAVNHYQQTSSCIRAFIEERQEAGGRKQKAGGRRQKEERRKKKEEGRRKKGRGEVLSFKL
jgi:hypothetical protein